MIILYLQEQMDQTIKAINKNLQESFKQEFNKDIPEEIVNMVMKSQLDVIPDAIRDNKTVYLMYMGKIEPNKKMLYIKHKEAVKDII